MFSMRSLQVTAFGRNLLLTDAEMLILFPQDINPILKPVHKQIKLNLLPIMLLILFYKLQIYLVHQIDSSLQAPIE